MKIQKIRISGFKSFTDPVVIEFRHNLIGIVGPNGCGKSNLFEAVRWAMGESFSKNIRAESGTAVIFNGSGNRKPAGRAEVELMFDNSDGRVGGRAGSWGEISVRRTINREAESNYYLNGSRCRKRDIAALFSGTGFGPRTYSMIGQGMITRIIDAKPDELRKHLEEAAGVSQYQRSRRETEARMRSTRDNLERIMLVITEVDKQLSALGRQAQRAERYRGLVVQEKHLQAQTLALSWQECSTCSAERQRQNSDLLTALEKNRSKLQAAVAEQEKIRLQLQSAEQECDDIQTSFHKLGTAVSVQERECQYSQEQRNSQQQQRQELSQKLLRQQQQLAQDNDQIRQLDEEIAQCNASLHTLREKADGNDRTCAEAEQHFAQCQQQLTMAKDSMMELLREQDTSAARIESLQQQLQQHSPRHAEIEVELKSREHSDHVEQLQSQRQLLQQLQQQCDAAEKLLQQHVEQLQLLRQEAVSTETELASRREELREIHAEFASLQALQNESLKSDAATSILGGSELADAPRLGEKLQVDGRWHLAVETVINKHLQDLELTTPDDLLRYDVTGGAIGAYRADLPLPGAAPDPPYPGLTSLAGHVHSPGLPPDFLAAVWTAPDADTALAARDSLPAGHSVITEAGIWLGRNWIRIGRPQEAGTLDRAAELKKIRSCYEQLQHDCRQFEQQLAEKRELQRTEDARLQDAREQLQALRDKLAQQQGEVAVGEVKVADRQERIRNLVQMLTDSSEEQNRIQREIDSLNAAVRLTSDKTEELRQQLCTHEEACDSARDKLEQSHASRDAVREAMHQEQLNERANNSRKQSLRESLQREEQNYQQQQTTMVELAASIDKLEQQIPEQQQKLQTALTERSLVEQRLQQKQQQLQQIKDSCADMETRQQEISTELHQCEELIQDNRVKIAEYDTRQEILNGQIVELGHEPRQLLQTISDNVDLSELQQELTTVQQKISNLGHVNLAAIEETGELEERKLYMDSQRDDLEKALKTMQDAIKRIDMESSKRFTRTYEQVNTNLQQTFTRLFGGGAAQLELLEQESGDPGVVIRARPPGKRGGLINILSGGEKTLVSLALIFSIFMLNPSPVCFLDEVDAPLDDINIGRFTSMLAAMSEQLQFVFITHNKLTMEMADVLFGITMQEAGVSKLVSVDTDEALRFANDAA